MEKLPKYTGEELFARMLAWADRHERSVKQVKDKMMRWNIPSPEARKVLDRLKKFSAVDDERFAQAYTSDAIRFKNWGRKKIELGLTRAGVDRSIQQKAFEAIDAEEYRNKLNDLIRIALKKGHTLDNYQSRMKLANHIARKGFEADDIFSVLDQIRDDLP